MRSGKRDESAHSPCMISHRSGHLRVFVDALRMAMLTAMLCGAVQYQGPWKCGSGRCRSKKVWKTVRIKYAVDSVWLPQFPRVRANNLEHTPTGSAKRRHREQFKRELKNWLFESTVHTTGGKYDRGWWKVRRINGLTYLLTLYHARPPLYAVKLTEQITNNSDQRTRNQHLHTSFNNVLNHKMPHVKIYHWTKNKSGSN